MPIKPTDCCLNRLLVLTVLLLRLSKPVWCLGPEHATPSRQATLWCAPRRAGPSPC